MLQLAPVTLKEANAFIAQRHRHHKPARGCRAVVGVRSEARLVGVAILERPKARMIAKLEPLTAEVSRLCTDGTPNACSKLYAACARAAAALGYTRVVTYILESESGVSVEAAGWTCDGPAGGGTWNRKGRPRVDASPTCRKTRWSKGL